MDEHFRDRDDCLLLSRERLILLQVEVSEAAGHAELHRAGPGKYLKNRLSTLYGLAYLLNTLYQQKKQIK